jgi:uncharacterized membrane protein YsdA (DUF1294 family)
MEKEPAEVIMTDRTGRSKPARNASSCRNPGGTGTGKKKVTFIARLAGFWPLAVIPGLGLSLYLRQPLPGLALAFLLNSLLEMLFYGEDKRLAERQEWRIPEATLHFWELFCGWPGALFAQACFRHKWKKLSYMVVFWLCVIVNVTVVLCILFPGEARSLVESGLAALKRS